MTEIRFGDTRLKPKVWKRVQRDENGCWLWTGVKNWLGYGALSYKGTPMGAHRVFYLALVGPIRAESLDHLCRNRACVRPAHLEPVSQRVNLLRGNTIVAKNAAKTHCKHGHEFTTENTYVDPRSKRQCRTCRRVGYGTKDHKP